MFHLSHKFSYTSNLANNYMHHMLLHKITEDGNYIIWQTINIAPQLH